MKTITMLELRRDAEGILALVERGERLILTRRGKPVARIEPIPKEAPDSDDPIYSIADIAQSGASLSNREIDEAIYGK